MIPLACTAVLATAPIPPVSSDAPDYSNGTVTIPPGAVQAEIGVDVTLPGSGLVERQVPVHIPTTLRIGLTDKIELRLFEGEPVLVEDRNRRVGGDTAFGLKIRFNEYAPHTRKPSFGIQPFVEFATLRLAKLFGCRTVWIDSISQIEALSMSGRHARKVADLWLTQWPHLAKPGGPEYSGTIL